MFQFHKPFSFKANRLIFGENDPLPSESEKLSAAERRRLTSKEIYADANKRRQDIQAAETLAGQTLDTDETDKTHLLKENTYILISQKGEGSKNNAAGWRGFADTTDSIKILDRKIKKINGTEYVKVQLKHKLYTKPNSPAKFRTYVGYIERSKFKDSAVVVARKELNAEKDGLETAKNYLSSVNALNIKYGKKFISYMNGEKDGIYLVGLRTNDGQKSVLEMVIDTSKLPYTYKIDSTVLPTNVKPLTAFELALKQMLELEGPMNLDQDRPQDKARKEKEEKNETAREETAALGAAKALHEAIQRINKRNERNFTTFMNALENGIYRVGIVKSDAESTVPKDALVKIDLDTSKDDYTYTVNDETFSNKNDALKQFETLLKQALPVKQQKAPEVKTQSFADKFKAATWTPDALEIGAEFEVKANTPLYNPAGEKLAELQKGDKVAKLTKLEKDIDGTKYILVTHKKTDGEVVTGAIKLDDLKEVPKAESQRAPEAKAPDSEKPAAKKPETVENPFAKKFKAAAWEHLVGDDKDFDVATTTPLYNSSTGEQFAVIQKGDKVSTMSGTGKIIDDTKYIFISYTKPNKEIIHGAIKLDDLKAVPKVETPQQPQQQRQIQQPDLTPARQAAKLPELHAPEADPKVVAKYTKAGKEFFAQGKYQKALESFKKGYEETKEPKFLFNQGLTYEALGQSAEAIKVYRQYAETPKLSPGDKQDALKRIKELTEDMEETTPKPEETPEKAAANKDAEKYKNLEATSDSRDTWLNGEHINIFYPHQKGGANAPAVTYNRDAKTITVPVTPTASYTFNVSEFGLITPANSVPGFTAEIRDGLTPAGKPEHRIYILKSSGTPAPTLTPPPHPDETPVPTSGLPKTVDKEGEGYEAVGTAEDKLSSGEIVRIHYPQGVKIETIHSGRMLVINIGKEQFQITKLPKENFRITSSGRGNGDFRAKKTSYVLNVYTTTENGKTSYDFNITKMEK